MFCGNPLAGGKAVSAGGEAAGGSRKAAGNQEGDRWDPETVYAQSRGRGIALLIAAVVLVAIVSVVYISQPGAIGISQRPFGPPLGTPGASGLTEMTAVLKEAGLIPQGDPYHYSDRIYQQFDASEIMGEKTEFSVAEVEEESGIAVSHAFAEEKGKYYSLERPGPVFKRLLDKLTSEFGKPVIQGAENYYYWTQKNEILVLYYGYDNVIWLSFQEKTGKASV